MRRVAVVAALTLSAGLGLAVRADAQCLVTPVGPMAVSLPALIPPVAPPFEVPLNVSTTPVARRVEGPHQPALHLRDYKRGVPDAE